MADEDSQALIIGDASALPSSSQGHLRSESESVSQSLGTGVSGSSATPAQGQVGDANDPVIVADQEQEQQPPTKKQKKQTSDVWQHFTKVIETVQVDGQSYEQVWAKCEFPNCRNKYRAESTKGTTGLWSHLRSAHGVVKGQQQLQVGKSHGKSVSYVEPFRYDPEVSIKKFYEAIIMHEYPFAMAEHEYFVDFVKSMRPNLPLKSRVTTRKEIMNIYLQEKDKLYAELKNIACRFSATMDMWTSSQKKAYMCVTIHWVDDLWHIQKRIINFFHVKGRHTGERLYFSFSEVMVRWYLENRMFALTLDNAAANEVAVSDIIDDLKKNTQVSLVCDGIFFHVRCACHILNLVAKDGMAVISQTIGNIRSLVLAVKGSPLQWEELMKRVCECGLDTKRGLSLDVSTRWNSTYMMLRDALYYKDAFIRLKSADRRRYDHISPTSTEWGNAVTIFQALKKFYDLTELLSGTFYPTANLFYKGFCDIRVLLAEWCAGSNVVIKTMALSMSEKFEKYWGKSNIALAVASFIDPRYKKRLIEFYMRKFYGDAYLAHLDEFVRTIRQLYQFYASTHSKPKTTETTSTPPDLFMDTNDSELESYLYESCGPDVVHSDELDKYMGEPLLKVTGQFDILAWWKNQTSEYPILSQIARDVLAVQVSTVASESAFSAGGRIVDPYRTTLDPETVEALVCTKDWLRATRKDSKAPPSIVGDLEILDVIREQLINDDMEEVA
ncbi:hypothetical protein E2562_035812 [Oryza meyeriana var. granulata]|uniref:BED-type domain-containing protein n=1 Tax=Oryza meyeriana var. granulata TaxID=110450 RepID=A0A6G1DAB1_9ORYZ|nr:hypothetical protein E2562_035812 [Oryza meyeriana var. granulata]